MASVDDRDIEWLTCAQMQASRRGRGAWKPVSSHDHWL